jgi:hypothetical protein
MFRIECFCDDGKLAKVLWLLQGNVYNVHPEPVVNAIVKNGRIQAKTRNVLELFRTWIHETGLHEVTPTHVQEFSSTIGKSNKYYSYLLRNAVDVGLLQRIGAEYRYRVITHQSAPALLEDLRPAAARKKRAVKHAKVKRTKQKRAKPKRRSPVKHREIKTPEVTAHG